LSFDKDYYNSKGAIINSDLLGFAKIPKARFENADGTDIIFDKDFFGNKRSSENIAPGPFTDLARGMLVLKVW